MDSKKKILVAISGGVDSAVCALLLKKQGFDVVGVHLIFRKENNTIYDAKDICKQIGIKLLTIDCTKQFKNEVIDRFIDNYQSGMTPNPCVICNPIVKIKELLKHANSINASAIATGHYARKRKRDSKFVLCKARDEKKDQSYFLYRLSKQQLEKILFPLGEYTKEDVKKIAKTNNIKVRQRESQDVCFFRGEEKLSEFLSKNINTNPGYIINESGVQLGKHKGIELFTIGQRHGLGISGGPFYVVDKVPKKKEVIVSSDISNLKLFPNNIELENTTWINEEPKEKRKYYFKTRYLSEATKGTIRRKGKIWKVYLEKPQWATTNGQSCVVIDRSQIIGGGIISNYY